jgi:hypothetical protein
MDTDALARVSLEGLQEWIARRQLDAREANAAAEACAHDLARGYRELKRRLMRVTPAPPVEKEHTGARG